MRGARRSTRRRVVAAALVAFVLGALATLATTEAARAAGSPPVANDDTYTVVHDQTLTVGPSGVLGNDTDKEGDPLTATLLGPVSSGLLALGSDGSFTYTPDPAFVGAVSFVYEAHDDASASKAAKVTIDVVDNPPSAADDAYTVSQDHTLSAGAPGVLGNDSDPDGDPVRAGLAVGPSNGSVSLNPDGSFTYTPDPGFTGTDAFAYVASDGIAKSNAANVTITVDPTRGKNRPPSATDDGYSLGQGQTLSVGAPGVLGNDSDPDGDPLKAKLSSGPSSGVLSFNSDGSFDYTPDPAFTGIDTFTYSTTDGLSASKLATVTVMVAGAATSRTGTPPTTSPVSTSGDAAPGAGAIAPGDDASAGSGLPVTGPDGRRPFEVGVALVTFGIAAIVVGRRRRPCV